MTGRQNQFETRLTWSLFRNPTVESSCLLSLLARDLCRLVIRRAEVVVKEPLSGLCVCVCVCVCVCDLMLLIECAA